MRRRIVAGEEDAGLGDVAAPKYAHRPQAFIFVALSLAVEKALHVGQEGHELLVMAFAEILRVIGELVGHFGPTARRDLLQQLPMALDLLPARMRDQLYRPQYDLAKLQHTRRQWECGSRQHAAGQGCSHAGRIRHVPPQRGWSFSCQPKRTRQRSAHLESTDASGTKLDFNAAFTVPRPPRVLKAGRAQAGRAQTWQLWHAPNWVGLFGAAQIRFSASPKPRAPGQNVA